MWLRYARAPGVQRTDYEVGKVLRFPDGADFRQAYQSSVSWSTRLRNDEAEAKAPIESQLKKPRSPGNVESLNIYKSNSRSTVSGWHSVPILRNCDYGHQITYINPGGITNKTTSSGIVQLLRRKHQLTAEEAALAILPQVTSFPISWFRVILSTATSGVIGLLQSLPLRRTSRQNERFAFIGPSHCCQRAFRLNYISAR